MINCDHCGKEVDERSLHTVGKYFVCGSCSGGYDEEELIERCDAKEADKLEDRARVANLQVFKSTIQGTITEDGTDHVIVEPTEALYFYKGNQKYKASYIYFVVEG